MLSLRFARAGRRNTAFFRIVLTDHSKPSKSGFIKVLGWYDPKTKKSSVDKEALLSWVKLGAMPSNSLSKFLEGQKISHKNIKFIPDAPKKPKEKSPARSASGTADAGGEKVEKAPTPSSTEEKSESEKIKNEENKEEQI